MQKVKLKCIDLSEILIARYRVSISLIRCTLYHGVYMIFAHRANSKGPVYRSEYA